MKFCRQCGNALGAPPPQPAYGAPGVPPPAMPPPAMAPPAMAPPSGIAKLSPLPSAGGTAAGPGGLLQTAGAPKGVASGSTITCPRCGTPTPVGFAYCQQCGLHIQPIAPTDPGALPGRARSPSRPAPMSVGAAAVDPQGATLAQPGTNPGAVPMNSPYAISPAIAPVPASTPVQPASRPSGQAWGTAILVNRDGTDGQRFSLTSDDTIVGRAGADIAFEDDRFLARQHARIARGSDGAVKITALDQLNGVFKKADGPVELDDGATILVGREVLRFEKVAPEERTIHPLVRHGVALFGSPPRDPWGRLLQLIPSGGYRDVRHLVGNEIVLGREEGDIVFRDDAFMSRRHAALTWDGRRAQLTDLGSSNGTFVRIAQGVTLKHGDHVRMGDQLLRIELGR